jgi:hypothetical protein
VGKTVEISNGAVVVGGIERRVDWGESKHSDCLGKIRSVETSVKGLVVLDDGSVFENCAICTVNELTTSALVSGWIKDSSVTGNDRLADRPECEPFLGFKPESKPRCVPPLSSLHIVPRSVGTYQSRGCARARVLHLTCMARTVHQPR